MTGQDQDTMSFAGGPPGLLLVTMQPPAAMEEEFHDWYDTEHLPEREAVEGILSARRYVCLEGWPRYMAMYDLAHVDVLREPGYLAISGDRFSPWSKRILSRMQGIYRAEGVQISSPPTLIDSAGPCAWLVLLRLGGLAESDEDALRRTVAQAYDDDRLFARARIFKTSYNGDLDYLVAIELRRPLSSQALQVEALAPFHDKISCLNIYSRYWRHGRLHGVLSR